MNPYEYGIRPWDMGRLTAADLRAIVAHHNHAHRSDDG